MFSNRYGYSINDDFLYFSFTSEGPNGKIKKVIRFDHVAGHLYNLAFGDLNEATNRLMDSVVTNNSDLLKVLGTLAASIHDFTVKYPEALIFIQGSTHSRTKLFRRLISMNWDNICAKYTIYGQGGYGWEHFLFGEDYTAFLIHRNNL